MASVDEIVAALVTVPSAEREGWRFADELSRLDEPVEPPEQPIPHWFTEGVERAVGWLATTWPQRPLFRPIRALDRAKIVTPARGGLLEAAPVDDTGFDAGRRTSSAVPRTGNAAPAPGSPRMA